MLASAITVGSRNESVGWWTVYDVSSAGQAGQYANCGPGDAAGVVCEITCKAGKKNEEALKCLQKSQDEQSREQEA